MTTSASTVPECGIRITLLISHSKVMRVRLSTPVRLCENSFLNHQSISLNSRRVISQIYAKFFHVREFHTTSRMVGASFTSIGVLRMEAAPRYRAAQE